MACKLPVLGLLTHQQKVKSLYKRALRNLKSYYPSIPKYRIQAVSLRARFDENKDIRDFSCAKRILKAGEEELFMMMHYAPLKFPNSFGGVAYEREVMPPDWVLDYWHPLEKAAYPEYFARREARKKQYIKLWEIVYGSRSKKRKNKEEQKIRDDYKCF